MFKGEIIITLGGKISGGIEAKNPREDEQVGDEAFPLISPTTDLCQQFSEVVFVPAPTTDEDEL